MAKCSPLHSEKDENIMLITKEWIADVALWEEPLGGVEEGSGVSGNTLSSHVHIPGRCHLA